MAHIRNDEEQWAYDTGIKDAQKALPYNPPGGMVLEQAYYSGYRGHYIDLATELQALSQVHASPELEAAAKFMLDIANTAIVSAKS